MTTRVATAVFTAAVIWRELAGLWGHRGRILAAFSRKHLRVHLLIGQASSSRQVQFLWFTVGLCVAP